MSSIQERITKIVTEQLDIKEGQSVVLESRFVDDLKADSLDQVELIMAFEEEFGIEIPDTDAEKIRSVADAVNYVEKHQA